jgi:hypothetical protein
MGTSIKKVKQAKRQATAAARSRSNSLRQALVDIRRSFPTRDDAGIHLQGAKEALALETNRPKRQSERMEQLCRAEIAHAIGGGEVWMNETLQRFEELAARAHAGDPSAEHDFFFEASQLFPIDFHQSRSAPPRHDRPPVHP